MSLGPLQLQPQKSEVFVNDKVVGTPLLGRTLSAQGRRTEHSGQKAWGGGFLTLKTVFQHPIPGCFQDSNPDPWSVLPLGLCLLMTSGGLGEVGVPACAGPGYTLASRSDDTEAAHCCLMSGISKL